MPLYEFRCPDGHIDECFEHAPDKGSQTVICQCGHSMGPVMSWGNPLTTWASESAPQTIWNMGPEPVTVTSMAQLNRIAKNRGLMNVGPKRGEKGCWT